MSSRRSRSRQSGSSRITEEQISDLVSKLQDLLPEARLQSNARVCKTVCRHSLFMSWMLCPELISSSNQLIWTIVSCNLHYPLAFTALRPKIRTWSRTYGRSFGTTTEFAEIAGQKAEWLLLLSWTCYEVISCSYNCIPSCRCTRASTVRYGMSFERMEKNSPLFPPMQVPSARVLQETCNYIRSLHQEVDDLSERLSELLATSDMSSVQAAIIRSLLM